MSTPAPERGEVWVADLDPVMPGGQGGSRPVLIVSAAAFNAWPAGLAVVVPLTTRERGSAHHVPMAGGGPERSSFAMPEYARSISQRRLRRRLGAAGPAAPTQVDDWLRRIMAL
ncbi:MAG TPA: type II toxin-antitoxin system PemK/MazF family toxin [Streptosporangiaceae bacterium]|nr:type II toxin-antitoxin system PemK/MazF family toxin [Streptosporangiaceae bacterium]